MTATSFQSPMLSSRHRASSSGQLAGSAQGYCSPTFDRTHEAACASSSSSRCASYTALPGQSPERDSPVDAPCASTSGQHQLGGSDLEAGQQCAAQQRLRHSHPYKSLGHSQPSARKSASPADPHYPPQQQHHSLPWWWCCPSPPRLPRTAVLCRLLVAFAVLLTVFHALSCGLFFCVRIPSPLDGVLGGGGYYDPVRFRGPKVITADVTSSAADSLPSLIPRIVHQAYRSDKVPPALAHLTDTWALLNEGWELRRYSEASAGEFVLREFPEYVEAYRLLPSWEDKADLFKFLVVLRTGGVYADVWAECKKPLDEVVLPKDTLVVGWDALLPSAAVGFSASQVSERVIGGAPGHPALREVADAFAAAVLHRSGMANRTRISSAAASGMDDGDDSDAPGIDRATRISAWTDIVLKHAVKHPLSENDPWSVRVLPGVVFGLRETDLRHVYPFESQIVAIGHEPDAAAGRSSTHGGFSFFAERIKLWLWPSSARHPAAVAEPLQRPAPVLRPVSASWDPPFTILSYGEDGTAAGAASDLLTNYGLWQPSLAPNRHPNAVEAVVGPLSLPYLRGKVLLDVGAGSGFFTLAAAARGHAVVAFELADAQHSTLAASLRYNGYEKNVTLIKSALGSEGGVACVSSTAAQGDEELERGYGRPQLHDDTGDSCQRLTRREVVSAALPANTSVGAVRISVNGWEARVLEGMEQLLREQRPWVILVEAYPLALAEVEAGEAAKRARAAANSSSTAGAGVGGNGPAAAEGVARFMQLMFDLGYHDVSHSGYICDERWANITASLRKQRGVGAAADTLQQPTWCRISPDLFSLLQENGKPGVPENILFAYKQERRPALDAGARTASVAGTVGASAPDATVNHSAIAESAVASHAAITSETNAATGATGQEVAGEEAAAAQGGLRAAVPKVAPAPVEQQHEGNPENAADSMHDGGFDAARQPEQHKTAVEPVPEQDPQALQTAAPVLEQEPALRTD